MANYFVQLKGRLKLDICDRADILYSKGQRMNRWRVLIDFNSGGKISRTELHSGDLVNAFMDIAEVSMPHACLNSLDSKVLCPWDHVSNPKVSAISCINQFLYTPLKKNGCPIKNYLGQI